MSNNQPEATRLASQPQDKGAGSHLDDICPALESLGPAMDFKNDDVLDNIAPESLIEINTKAPVETFNFLDERQ